MNESAGVGSAPEVTSAVVPAVGSMGSLATVRSLGRAGVTVIAVSERPNPPSFCSRYCEETLSVPSPETDLPGYRDALLSLARREDVGTIVPVRDVDVHVLATQRATFAEHVGTPWPTADQLEAVHDRLKLFDAAERAGVAVPETQLLDEVEDWDRQRVVKGRHAVLTPGTTGWVGPDTSAVPPKTLFLEPGVEPDVGAIVRQMGHVPIAQSYLEGPEFCLRALYRDGEPVVTSQKRLIRGYKYSRGPSVYHEAVDLPDLEAAGLALLDELDWHGMASVGFIRDESGSFRLLEVNARIPASVPLDVHAGVDYPTYLWQLARDGTVSATPEYRPGTASHLLRGELVHLHSVAREEYPLVDRPGVARTVSDIATSLVAHPRFDCLDLRDPAPFLRDVANTARGVLEPAGSEVARPPTDAAPDVH